MRTRSAGFFLLTLLVANPLVAQDLTIFCGRKVVLQTDLPPEGWSVSYEITLSLELQAGVTMVTIGAPGGKLSGGRILHLALLDARLEARGLVQERHGIRRLERPLRLPDVTADKGFAPAEGPFPNLGFDGTLQWQLAPEGTLTLRARRAGAFLLTITVANVFSAQEVAILRGKKVLIRVDLPAEGWQVSHEIEIVVDLFEGDNNFTIVAPNGNVTNDRSLHLAFLGGRLSETDRGDGRCEVRRLERPTFAAQITAEGGFEPVEGPFPEFGLDRTLQWLVRPKGLIAVRAPSAGWFLLTIAFANPYATQEIAIARDTDTLARFTLEAEDWNVWHEVAIVLEVPKGTTSLTVTAPEGLATKTRKLHLAFFEARLEPTNVNRNLHEVRRRVRPPRTRQAVTAGDGFAALEGPFLDLGIEQAVQWQVCPDASLTIHVAEAGSFLVTIIVASPHVRQTLAIALDGDVLASVNLQPEGWSVAYEIALALELPPGGTCLTLSAPNALHEADRDLHLVLLDAQLGSTHVGDGLRSVRRMKQGSDGSPHSQVVPSLPTDLLIGSGFADIEGPYPERGVPVALAWQIERKGRLRVFAAADSLAIDVVVPCDQVITVQTGGISRVFDVPRRAGWERPSRVILRLGQSHEGWRDVELTCEHEYHDDSGRTLHLALLGAQSFSGFPERATDRYGPARMPLNVCTARA